MILSTEIFYNVDYF